MSNFSHQSWVCDVTQPYVCSGVADSTISLKPDWLTCSQLVSPPSANLPINKVGEDGLLAQFGTTILNHTQGVQSTSSFMLDFLSIQPAQFRFIKWSTVTPLPTE